MNKCFFFFLESLPTSDSAVILDENTISIHIAREEISSNVIENHQNGLDLVPMELEDESEQYLNCEQNENEEPVENWRNLNSTPTTSHKKRRNVYSILQPQANPHGLRSRNISIMQSPTIYRSKKTNLKNTCAFDALVMGFLSMYEDHLPFRDMIDMDDADFSIFIRHFSAHGYDSKTKNERLKILCNIFNHNKDKYSILDCKANVSEILEKISDSKHFYSLKQTYKNVSEYKYILIQKNVYDSISNLEKNIFIDRSDELLIELNQYICIEIIQTNWDSEINLKDIPKSLNILNSSFKLSTVIHFIKPIENFKNAIGHYQAYCFRTDNKIDVFDNNSKKKLSHKENVVPHLIFYVKISL